MASRNLTQALIEALRPRKAAIDIRDANLRGFGIRVYPTGRKRYFIHSQFEGQRVWKVVGDAANVSLDEAREQARVMLAAVRDDKQVSSQALLFEVVAEEVFRRYGRNWKPRTLAVNRSYLANQILPWFQGRPITCITNADVREWFASLYATPVAADRSAPVLSVIMAQAETYGYRPEGSNPCTGIRRYRRQGRQRFLSEAEVRRLGRVLEHHEADDPMYVAIVRLLLLTGCRRREIVTLHWKAYREGHLYLDDSKTGPRMVWLSSPARLILDERPRISPWVFPSTTTNRSVEVSTIQYFWQRLRSEAGLPDVRLHDLRHTFASMAVMSGENILTVGRLLGHNDPGTTLKYTHLANDAAAEAARSMGPILGGRAA
ncbi:MAG: tyrosine-type recombinase/integrase [bacterium]|nr:tyrosine-type recombinase/integrase [bacterium]MDE0240812.1 tyrosine-type recombinase/integrase [bacterium]